MAIAFMYSALSANGNRRQECWSQVWNQQVLDTLQQHLRLDVEHGLDKLHIEIVFDIYEKLFKIIIDRFSFHK